MNPSSPAIDWLPATGPSLAWLGAAEIETVDDGAVPWRLPRRDIPILAPGLVTAAQVASGVRLAFLTDAGEVRIRVTSSEPSVPITMVSGDTVVTREIIPSACEVSFGPPGEERVEIWLPHQGRTVVDSVGVTGGARIEPAPAPPTRWLAYGSSITQSMHADNPIGTWPAQVARRHQLDLYNLGFASEAHLDPPVARHLATTRADLITLSVGINVYIAASMSLRTYRAALLEMIRVVRAGHPGVPIVVVSPIWSPRRERVPCFPRLQPPLLRGRLAAIDRLARIDALYGPTLGAVRDETAGVVELLVELGDADLSHVDGRELLGPDDADALVDGLHPGQAGDDLLADRFSERVVPALTRA